MYIYMYNVYTGKVSTYTSPTTCKKSLKYSIFRLAWGFPLIFFALYL